MTTCPTCNTPLSGRNRFYCSRACANGRARSETIATRLAAGLVRNEETGCVEWQGYVNADGYGQIGTTSRKVEAVHRVSYRLNIGQIPDGLMVCHRCDNRRCAEPSHLFLGTAKDNNLDRDNKGRGARLRGSTNGWSKLSEAQVKEILALRETGESYSRIGARYSVTWAAIQAICTGKNWKHLTNKERK